MHNCSYLYLQNNAFFSGSILLDLEADDLSGIVTRVTEQLVMDDLLNPESQGKVIATLLLKHT